MSAVSPFVSGFEASSRSENPLNALGRIGKRLADHSQKASEPSSKRGKLNDGGYAAASNDQKDGFNRLAGDLTRAPGFNVGLNGGASNPFNPHVNFKVLTGVMESFPTPKSWADAGVKNVHQGYDGGMTAGRDDWFNNNPLSHDMPMSLVDYASHGASNPQELKNLLSTVLPLFRNSLCTTPRPRSIKRDEISRYSNLAQVNAQLKADRGPHWRYVSDVYPYLKLLGSLSSVVEKASKRYRMELLGSFQFDGPVRLVNLWARCKPAPLGGRFLCLALVIRTLGFEDKEERAYESGHDAILKVHIEIKAHFARKAQIAKNPALADLNLYRYWKIVPVVSESAQLELQWFNGVDWQGHFWCMGRDLGNDVDALASNTADRATDFVTASFPSCHAESTEMMAKAVMKTGICLGSRGIQPV
jgi:hypothetical protein